MLTAIQNQLFKHYNENYMPYRNLAIHEQVHNSITCKVVFI